VIEVRVLPKVQTNNWKTLNQSNTYKFIISIHPSSLFYVNLPCISVLSSLFVWVITSYLSLVNPNHTHPGNTLPNTTFLKLSLNPLKSVKCLLISSPSYKIKINFIVWRLYLASCNKIDIEINLIFFKNICHIFFIKISSYVLTYSSSWLIDLYFFLILQNTEEKQMIEKWSNCCSQFEIMETGSLLACI
jgi:hypothetical protein